MNVWILFKIKTVWSEGETRMLLDLYVKYLPLIGPLKRFKNKKEMWYKISEDIPNKSAKQCRERYKTILRRKKSAVENNNTSAKESSVQDAFIEIATMKEEARERRHKEKMEAIKEMKETGQLLLFIVKNTSSFHSHFTKRTNCDFYYPCTMSQQIPIIFNDYAAVEERHV
ncbi:uncharacterized protein LOC142228983 [Haematobia irritans]|uniref:uncharacterized protein LOC142228983 n=1 Tax=Haematobia irritans TaxID=7368 RepID=UPI003F4F7F0F